MNKQDVEKDSYSKFYCFVDIHRLSSRKWIVNGLLFVSTLKLRKFAATHLQSGNWKHFLNQNKILFAGFICKTSHIIQLKKTLNKFCFKNVFFTFFTPRSSQRKDTVFTPYKSNLRFAFLKTIEVGQFFYFKTLLFIANLKSLICFFDILKIFPISTLPQIAKCYIFKQKPISFWTN